MSARPPILRRLLLACVFAGLIGGCATSAPTPISVRTPASPATPTHTPIPAQAFSPKAPSYWPTEGWRTSSPERQGMESEQLAQMLTVIQAQDLNIHSALVIRNGFIVAEAYFFPFQQHTKHVIFSCTKSFISALVGIAVELGFIDGINVPVLDLFPERTFANVDPRKQRLKLEHMLAMTSGLDWPNDAAAITRMLRSEDWVQFVLDRPMAAEPGSRFNYCSGCSHVMSAIIQERSGLSTLEFAQRYLFDPLGITDFAWMTDPQEIPGGGWGLEMRSRDMAKLGYLYLNGGVWDGQQVVPADWVHLSVEKQVEAEDGINYGFQWWLYPRLGAFAAQGFGAQLILTIPHLELVTVFTAALLDSRPLFELVEQYIVPAVRSSEPLPDNPEGVARLRVLTEEVAKKGRE